MKTKNAIAECMDNVNVCGLLPLHSDLGTSMDGVEFGGVTKAETMISLGTSYHTGVHGVSCALALRGAHHRVEV
jgi:hypothetical protein